MVWNEIRSLVSKNAVLFIGYSFEDTNVKVIFDDILKRLGESHQNYYLIAPSIPEYKRDYYREKYSIRFIQMSAEKAIPKLHRVIEKYLMEDITNGNIPQIKISQICEERKIQPEFVLSSDGKMLIKSIKSQNNKPISINIKFQIPKDQRAEIEKIENLMKGKEFGEFELTSEKRKLEFCSKIGVHLLSNIKENDKAVIKFKSEPYQVFKADLVLKKSGLKFVDIECEHYISEFAALLKIIHKNFTFELKFLNKPTEKFKIKFSFFNITTVAQGLEIYNFFSKWFSGDDLQVYLETFDEPIQIFNSDLTIPQEKKNFIVRTNRLFEQLFIIQRIFGLKFSHLEMMSETDIGNIESVTKRINGKNEEIESFTTSFKIEENERNEFINMIKNLIENSPPTFKILNTAMKYTILKKEIQIDNCSIEINNCFIENQDEVINAFKQGNIDIPIKFASKTREIVVSSEKLKNE